MADWRAGNLVGLGGSLIGLSATSVGLRFYIRRRNGIPWDWHDWLVLMAFAAFVGCCGCVFAGVRCRTLGVSTLNLSTEDISRTRYLARRLRIAIYAISYFALASTKASVLFLYWRIFDVPIGSWNIFRILLWSTIVMVAVWFILSEALTGVLCDSRFLIVQESSSSRYCTYSYMTIFGCVISDVLLNVWILLLPVPRILRLQLPRIKKLEITGVFLLAFIGLGASIARMVAFKQEWQIGLDELESIESRLTDSRLVFYLTLEMGMSIIGTNMPVIYSPCLKLGSSVRKSVQLYFSSSDVTTHLEKPTFKTDRHKSDVERQQYRHYQSWDFEDEDELISPCSSCRPLSDKGFWESSDSFGQKSLQELPSITPTSELSPV